MPTLETAPQTHTNKTNKPDFGNGRYSAFMQEAFEDAKHIFGLTPEQAEKLSRQMASEFGAIMANSPVKPKVGKPNDDGKVTLGEAVKKVKGVTMTPALSAMRALDYANEAVKNGFSRNSTEWKPVEALATFLVSL